MTATATRTRRARPKSPTQIAADKASALIALRMQDFAAVGLQAASAVLPSQRDIEVKRANQEHIETARRMDAFEALKDGMVKGAFDAAVRLQTDMLTRSGLGDKGRWLDRVDNGQASAEMGRLDRILAAAEAVERVLSRMADRDRWLLTWLIEPPLGRFDHWRDIVHHITGETNPNAQGAVVRYAASNLRDAYEQTDRVGG